MSSITIASQWESIPLPDMDEQVSPLVSRGLKSFYTLGATAALRSLNAKLPADTSSDVFAAVMAVAAEIEGLS